MAVLTHICEEASSRRRLLLSILFTVIALYNPRSPAQSTEQAPTTQSSDETPSPTDAQVELQQGTALTRSGHLEEAIPHLLAAQQAGADRYATTVNLAICNLGLGRYPVVIDLLTMLRSTGIRNAVVDNLLTQAYLGTNQTQLALATFDEAAILSPTDEKLYAFIADACTDHHAFTVGLRITEIGLKNIPDSARLHYERALFLAQLDRLTEARPEFQRAASLAPNTYIANLALVQLDLYDDRFPDAIKLLHEAIDRGHRDGQTLSLLGTVLISAGAQPGHPEFVEAQSVLEESAQLRPNYSATQLALGKLYLMEDRFQPAVDHLEIALRLEPENPAVYTSLAHAYRRLGDREKASRMQAALARLLAEKKPPATP